MNKFSSNLYYLTISRISNFQEKKIKILITKTYFRLEKLNKYKGLSLFYLRKNEDTRWKL